MPKYQCPECAAVLRRENPVAPGKKIRCPKCETVFVAEPIRDEAPAGDNVKKKPRPETKAEAKPLPKKPVDDDEDEEGGTYGIAADEPEDANKKNRDVDYGSLRDKYEKSTRGPAMARLVNMSSGMLAIGILTVLGSVIGIMVLLWPFIFSDDSPTGREARTQILLIVAGVFGGVYGGCICYAASKLHELESYAWSIAGVILIGIIGLGFTICGIIGIAATLTAMNSDPEARKVEPLAEGQKIVRGKTSNVLKAEMTVDTTDKKQMTIVLNGETKLFKKRDKKIRDVDLRDGVEVKVVYTPLGDRGTAVSVVVDPEDGEPDDTFVLMLFMLLYLVVLAYGIFAIEICRKTFTRLKEEEVLKGFEETQTKREY